MKAKVFVVFFIIALMINPVWSIDPVYELKNISNRQSYLLKEFQLSQRYFNIYLNKDTGRAKTLYLYMTQKMESVADDQEKVEALLVHLDSTETEDGVSIASKSIDTILEIKKIYYYTESRLRNRYVAIDQLKESADMIETDFPLIEIIEGRLDSDFDGIPDNIELNGYSNSPVTGL